MKKRGPKPKDITSFKFGRLTAKEYVGHERWRFVCDCGREKIAWATDVRRGKIKSCGCLSVEKKATGDYRRKHGGCGTPEYSSWYAMIRRCTDPDNAAYHLYGGRGITVCEQWLESFQTFLADMGKRPRGTSIDRENVNGNYEPGNCRWATDEVQSSNKRNNRLITANGRTQTTDAWARELGCSSHTLRYRRQKGWGDEEIINTPVQARRRW